MATSIDKFLELVGRSSLIPPSQLVDACQGFAITRDDPQALDDLCRHLMAKGLLTDWQCEKLRVGKYKGFFLGGYCLLRKFDEDPVNMTLTFLCKEVNSDRRVAMLIASPASTKSGRIQYKIRELP
jgi:eukaryotic-like serine/threonine-protein kinase